jgi:hypothetical protein
LPVHWQSADVEEQSTIKCSGVFWIVPHAPESANQLTRDGYDRLDLDLGFVARALLIPGTHDVVFLAATQGRKIQKLAHSWRSSFGDLQLPLILAAAAHFQV